MLYHLNIDAFNFRIAPKNGNITFDYVGSSENDECNGGIANLKDINVVKPVYNLEFFLTTTYGSSVVQNIGFIKIDAEGFDGEILKSLFGLIEKSPYQFPIQVEYYTPWVQWTIANGVLHSGLRELLSVIKSTPRNYQVSCAFSFTPVTIKIDQKTHEIIGAFDRFDKIITCTDLLLSKK